MLGTFVPHNIPSGEHFTLLLQTRKLKLRLGQGLMQSQGCAAGREVGCFLSQAPHLSFCSTVLSSFPSVVFNLLSISILISLVINHFTPFNLKRTVSIVFVAVVIVENEVCAGRFMNGWGVGMES